MSEEYRMWWCPVCQKTTAHEDMVCIDDNHPEPEEEEEYETEPR